MPPGHPARPARRCRPRSDTVGAISPDDAARLERRHRPGPAPWWHELWEVDLVSPALGVGAYLRLTSWPGQHRTSCWAALVGDGRPLVTVVEDDGPALGPAGLDVRAEGLWADQICETPLEHWTVGLEAFGVALDDPAEAFSGCRGDRTALGLDLEWESEPDAVVEANSGYELACRVHGEILVGTERLVVDDGWGRRRHRWGDGPTEAVTTGDTTGRVWGRVDGTRFDAPAAVVLDAAGMPAPLTVSVGGAIVEVVPRHHAPVSSTTGIRLHRSLASVGEIGSPSGEAWVERWEG